LNFSGQTLNAGAITTLSSEHITGFGKINGSVTANGGVSVASGGTLDLGGSGQVQLNGSTLVGANGTLILRDVNQAELRGNTTLANGSKLTSFNGVLLASSRTLTATGSATIQGAFTNLGDVSGPLGSGQLTFEGAVNGDGNYSGNIRFASTFAPGNSPAAVTFDDNATFAASSVLEMELLGLSPGIGYDKIMVYGTLILDGGALNVLYLGGFTAHAGNVFDLFDWGSLSGTFGEVHLPGLSSGLTWDLSRLYVDGSISVRALTAPVPEPETYAMLLAGLGLVGWQLRRRKQREFVAA